MKSGTRSILSIIMVLCVLTVVALAQDTVKIANGTLEGVADKTTGIRSFKGVPFGAPPVGDLRWKIPQPVKNWQGARKADKFGARCMQRNLFGDMNFRANGMSEDCLYLNVWTPAKTGREKLPVLVYFYGGGFMAGDGSEPRYDGESMARKGIVAITVNYRLGVFGFMAHPELTKESPNHASGNYALFDQRAALLWVQQNIAAFGGDPKRVTIAGESAGSIAVSAQMASPLSKNLIAGAIGESGSIMGALSAAPAVFVRHFPSPFLLSAPRLCSGLGGIRRSRRPLRFERASFKQNSSGPLFLLSTQPPGLRHGATTWRN